MLTDSVEGVVDSFGWRNAGRSLRWTKCRTAADSSATENKQAVSGDSHDVKTGSGDVCGLKIDSQQRMIGITSFANCVLVSNITDDLIQCCRRKGMIVTVPILMLTADPAKFSRCGVSAPP